jgi:hypothetical protein
MRGRNDKWLSDVVAALEDLGGEASLSELYDEVKRIKASRGEVYPQDGNPIVRRSLENFCAESDAYLDSYDLFRMSQGKGQGVWRLNSDGLDKYKQDIGERSMGEP